MSPFLRLEAQLSSGEQTCLRAAGLSFTPQPCPSALGPFRPQSLAAGQDQPGLGAAEKLTSAGTKG